MREYIVLVFVMIIFALAKIRVDYIWRVRWRLKKRLCRALSSKKLISKKECARLLIDLCRYEVPILRYVNYVFLGHLLSVSKQKYLNYLQSSFGIILLATKGDFIDVDISDEEQLQVDEFRAFLDSVDDNDFNVACAKLAQIELFKKGVIWQSEGIYKISKNSHKLLPSVNELQDYKRKEKAARYLLWDDENYSQAMPKLNIPLISAILSFLFLTAGFVYSSILIRMFGIRPSDYFTITDYVSASATTTGTLLVSMTICVAVLIIMWKRAQRIIPPDEHSGLNLEQVLTRAYVAIPLFIGVIGSFWSAYKIGVGTEMMGSFLAFAMFPFSGFVACLFRKADKMRVFSITLLSYIFYGSIIVNAITFGNEIKTGTAPPSGYTLKFESATYTNASIVCANSGYFFIYDSDNIKIYSKSDFKHLYHNTDFTPTQKD